MFTSSSTKLVEGHDATKQNLNLLLLSDTNTLLGDPYFGTPLKKFLFERNGYIIQDLVIDSIYTSVLTFMPQVQLTRNNIQLEHNKDQLSATIRAVNMLDYVPDMYSIDLTSNENT